ncbi:putative SOS response-associated peptidase YedK [Sinorhizobium fredii]|uniref:Uncharacterized protein n=1 Tax=Sinorhizobium fredii (strain USDA 257) TaxID=1185652 RepID=I3X5B6_SINF2|nr:hypothetical protein USDA257_c24960 [Sinorhizobium fredii USDA 257]
MQAGVVDRFQRAVPARAVDADGTDLYAVLPGIGDDLSGRIEAYHDRQIVILERNAWADWLDPTVSAKSLIKPLPAGTLAVEHVG